MNGARIAAAVTHIERKAGIEERARMAEVRAMGFVPSEVSSEIPIAPARGPVVPFREGYWHEKAGKAQWRWVPYRSGCPGRVRDIFDTMTDQATRRGGDLPFTEAQVGTARDYRALYERVQAAGFKRSKAFDVQMGGQCNTDFITAYMRDTNRLARFHAAVGDGIAKEIKRPGPGQTRHPILVRRLVDDVCIRQYALSEVLKAHGWAVSGENRKALQDALCASLGRMQGI